MGAAILPILLPDRVLVDAASGPPRYVLYGSAAGLAGANQTFTQANSESGDAFGTALAKGDFDGDGITDLAVGASGEGVSGAESAGAVSVYYGTENGLPGASGQTLFQGNPEDFDLFGDAVAAGRFNADGFDDLAVGASGETVGGDPLAGAVTVFYGSAGGLGSAGQAIFQANPEAGDQFGEELLAGLLNGGMDALSDLVVGAPGETVRGAQFAGAVDVLYVTSSGLPSLPSAELYQNNPEEADGFGSALAAGDFGFEDATPDVAVGAPGETVGGRRSAGAVSILLGVAGGQASGGPLLVQGASAGGNPEAGDQFGFSLASGELQDSGRSDLAIGAPGEDVGALTDSGVVHVQYGTPGGLFGAGFLSQDTTNVPGQAEAGDTFGLAMTTGGFSNNTGVPNELAVGAPGEDVGTAREAGAVNILRGVVLGGPPSGGQLFTQGRVAGGQPEPLDSFGAALA
jgi:FG-GAP repeat